MKIGVWIASALALAPSSLAWVAAPHRGSRKQASIRPTLRSSLLLQQTNSSLTEEMESSSPQQKRQMAQDVLDHISVLKTGILEDDNDDDKLEGYRRQVDQLEARVVQMESELVPPAGLTMEEYQSAMVLFLQLPFAVRCAFCHALELEHPAQAATDLRRLPEIVTLLYQRRIQVTPQRLQDSWKAVNQRMAYMSSPNQTVEVIGTSPSSTTTKSLLRSFLFLGNDNNNNDNATSKTTEELQKENTVKSIMGRVTRKDGVAATRSDLDRMLQVLDKSTFVVSSTEPIPGGFLLRGKRAPKLSGADLIQAIDRKLPGDYPAQIFFMADITSPDAAVSEMAGSQADPVLVLLNKDFSPAMSSILSVLSSTVAILTAFAFCVSVFGPNDAVSERLSEATSVNDSDGVSWFTGQVYNVLVPILALQAVHEGGHFAVTKANKFDMGSPTLIPFYGLPFLGSKTDLLSSPPNRNALFDFAATGPLLGVVASLTCFVYGLQLTAAADPAAAQFFPALPLDLIQKSTLGGSMIDYFLGGGMGGYENRFITLQDPHTPVALHPLAIAGFTSLVMNALALLPLGSTDGGRLSQAIFGRYGHLVISSFVWVALLITTFIVEKADFIFITWAINNIIQNDCEIPCRDETEEVSFPRIMVAITLWFLTSIALTPL